MPGTLCCVPLCNERGGFSFPRDPALLRQWLVAIRRSPETASGSATPTGSKTWVPSKHSVVCEKHFTSADFTPITFHGTTPVRRRLKKQAVPSLFLWKKKLTPSQQARTERASLRHRNITPDVTDVQHEEIVVTEESMETTNAIEETQSPISTATQTEQGREFNLPPVCIERYARNDAAIRLYTGLESYSKFCFVLASLGPVVHFLKYRWGDKPKMSIENQFFMTLIKLRTYRSNEELALNFETSTNNVANIIVTWINLMYHQWKEIDIWPSKELVRKYMPADFAHKFPKTRVILDGAEFPIKKPKRPQAQQVTFSTYKNRNTLKIIVGATPGGLVSHIPAVFGGSASDRALVEHSDLLSKIEPKDEVMVDKGFNIQDILAPHDVKLAIPTFLKKRNRLKPSSRISDKKIASKRVHIERLIGLAKTYKILTSPLTPHDTEMGEQLIFCCFMLCNFRETIVPNTA